MSAPAPESATAAPALAGHDLCCRRGEQVLFAGLELALRPGTLLQVEGPNGSGKTTLLRAVCGLVPLEAGGISWQGMPIEEAADAYHAALAYVGHVPGVKHDLTPRENLAAARALAAPGADGPPVDTALQRLGLAGLGDTPLRRLSAGQCRRVALGRLLLAPVPLWILDEPFTALDAAGRALVERLLGEHCAGGGMALVATHHALALDDIVVEHLRLGD